MAKNILTIANAQWSVTGTIPDSNQVYIKGQGSGGINIPATKATVSGAVVSISNVAASTAFPANQTLFYNPFTVQWQVSFDGAGGTYYNAGTSQNMIYVALSDTGPTTVTLYRTMVHLACGTPGATNADQAVTNTWGRFTGRAVCKWNETSGAYDIPLYYYKKDTSWTDNGDGTTAHLLKNTKQTGQCRCWASIMHEALLVNGVANDKIQAVAKSVTLTPPSCPPVTFSQAFLVKDWTFGGPTNPLPWTGYPYLFDFPGSSFDMVPPPTGGVYGDLTNQNTLAGQNTSPPSEKFFGNHVFLKYTDSHSAVTYYDPSYGGTYTSEADFQAKAIDAYGVQYQTDPITGHLQYLLKKPGAAVEIVFGPG